MSKQERQEAIMEIISAHKCCTQEDLLKELQKREIFTTQATISRDIRQLGLVKIQNKPGVFSYAVRSVPQEGSLSGDDRTASIIMQAVLSIDYAMNTVVVKCRNGMANAACVAFESMGMASVVGTLAGDDTIFILMRSEESAKQLCRSLSQMILQQ